MILLPKDQTDMTSVTASMSDLDLDSCGDGDSVQKTSIVQFSLLVKVCHIDHINDFSSEDIENLWYAPEDYEVFNDQCEVYAQQLEIEMRWNPKTYKARHREHGLEAWTREGCLTRRRNRFESLDVVLDEQIAQWNEGVDDDESIAELYKARSQHAQMVALTRGLALEREVKTLVAATRRQFPGLFPKKKSSKKHSSKSSSSPTASSPTPKRGSSSSRSHTKKAGSSKTSSHHSKTSPSHSKSRKIKKQSSSEDNASVTDSTVTTATTSSSSATSTTSSKHRKSRSKGDKETSIDVKSPSTKKSSQKVKKASSTKSTSSSKSSSSKSSGEKKKTSGSSRKTRSE
eukprot:Nitzschia sp. Nitz4//scaffold109_size72162//37708//38739//NITZ4_005848-RA/size72162-processed-gene-0.13-mRNA-1//1//CDS//3329532769//9302//frame0